MFNSHPTRISSALSSFIKRATGGLLICAAAATLSVSAQTTQKPATTTTADPHAAHKQQTEKTTTPSAPQPPQGKKTPLPPQDPHAGHHQHMKAAEAAKKDADGQITKMSIPDLELLDQNGKKIRFYTDLVKDRVVVINFIFTTCTTICPPLGATFARVQKDLGERVGRDVHFISISVDPVTDTPERLKAWGAKFKAGAGWTFVTGNKTQMDELLRALASTVARREDHSPTVIIGNDAKGTWTRTYGLAKPSQLVGIINAMSGESTTTTTSSAQATKQ
ncbi:MAG TPA: SCO family protein [Pyrinomonadaceae bacterium]|jgi:cytochrome oxidase Cu insertion factor (SCO1/SenC/PrrC family)